MAKREQPTKLEDPKGMNVSGNLQRVQNVQDAHGPGYCNDVPNDWRRGGGPGGAEGKPGFDHSKNRKRK